MSDDGEFGQGCHTREKKKIRLAVEPREPAIVFNGSEEEGRIECDP